MYARTQSALIVTALLVVIGCRKPEASATRSPTVAEIDGVSIPLSSFQNYLAVHFIEETLEEPVPREDEDRVKSRLFDDFVAESLLVLEGDRRGVQVDNAEVAAWLGGEVDPDPARESGRREQARRELIARRLLDAWMRAEDKADRDSGSPVAAVDDAAARLVASLRARYRIELHTGVLPFSYVPESPDGRAVP